MQERGARAWCPLKSVLNQGRIVHMCICAKNTAIEFFWAAFPDLKSPRFIIFTKNVMEGQENDFFWHRRPHPFVQTCTKHTRKRTDVKENERSEGYVWAMSCKSYLQNP